MKLIFSHLSLCISKSVCRLLIGMTTSVHIDIRYVKHYWIMKILIIIYQTHLFNTIQYVFISESVSALTSTNGIKSFILMGAITYLSWKDASIVIIVEHFLLGFTLTCMTINLSKIIPLACFNRSCDCLCGRKQDPFSNPFSNKNCKY